MKDGSQGTGFFCKIPFPTREKLLPVLIMNNHIINQDLLHKEKEKVSLIIKNEKKVKTINLNNRTKYTNPDYDITILELRDEIDDIHNFLELDDIIIENILDNNMNKDSNQVFIGETIYIIQYPEGKLSVSYNILNSIYEDKKNNFNHFCSTKNGSSGSPILNISTNKIIGIHKESSELHNYNRGTFLNWPIIEFIQKYCFNMNNSPPTINEKKNSPLNSYLNSILQCLFHIPEINSFFIKIYPKQKQIFKTINRAVKTKGLISEEFFDIISQGNKTININNKSVIKNNSYKKISTQNFENTLIKLRYQVNESQDLFIFLIQSMHEELNYFGNKNIENFPKYNEYIAQEAFNYFMKVYSELNLSIISYLFYGITKKKTQCIMCKNILYNFQYFLTIKFELFNYKNLHFNVYHGLQDYIKEKVMKGDNKCFCQICSKLTESKVTSKIFYTPPYLIFYFDYGKDKKSMPKKIEFGSGLFLAGITVEECTKTVYDLFIINAYDNKSKNNFVSYVKCDKTKSWIKFNDSNIEEISFENLSEIKPSFLIYKRIDNSDFNLSFFEKL